MERYYYHGIEIYENFSDTLEIVLKVLKEGINVRHAYLQGEENEYNHVCLYKKNEVYDYNEENMIYSARSGWIDHCCVFVIDPNIVTLKAPSSTLNEANAVTNLVDEWRSNGSISLDKIVGLALPLNSIGEFLNSKPRWEEEQIDQEKTKDFLNKIKIIAKEMGLFIANSDIDNFTDKLDLQLNEKKKGRFYEI